VYRNGEPQFGAGNGANGSNGPNSNAGRDSDYAVDSGMRTAAS
jgi:hypothetical protein